MAERNLRDLERALGYSFRNRRLLEQALTHGSSREDLPPGTPVQDYERLEFLGDAVLDLIVADHFMRAQPTWDEGQMTKARSALVSRRGLERVVGRIGIAPHIRAGPGLDKADERGRKRVLADVYEALVGAIYTDSGGVPAAADFVRKTLIHRPAPEERPPPAPEERPPRAPEKRPARRKRAPVPAPAARRPPRRAPRPPAREVPRQVPREFPRPAQRATPRLAPAPVVLPQKGNFKSELNDLLQVLGRPLPEYRTLRAVGPEHQKTWFVEVFVRPEIRTTGKGLTVKDAEQRAAQKALAELRSEPPKGHGRGPRSSSRQPA